MIHTSYLILVSYCHFTKRPYHPPFLDPHLQFSSTAPFSSSLFDSHNSFLLSPSHSECDRQQNKERIQCPTSPTHQPIVNSHMSLLHRTTDNCPENLSGKKRNRWIKAGIKAKNNHQLIPSLPRFQCPESYFDPPIQVHYLHRILFVSLSLCRLRFCFCFFFSP